MRSWLYEQLVNSRDMQRFLGGDLASAKLRVVPREARTTINLEKPFVIYGLGNETNEDLMDDTEAVASRQFFQLWFHDEGASYLKIDEMMGVAYRLMVGASVPDHRIMTIRWLENSQEFANETYNTIFRYSRFQAILGRGAALP